MMVPPTHARRGASPPSDLHPSRARAYARAFGGGGHQRDHSKREPNHTRALARLEQPPPVRERDRHVAHEDVARVVAAAVVGQDHRRDLVRVGLAGRGWRIVSPAAHCKHVTPTAGQAWQRQHVCHWPPARAAPPSAPRTRAARARAPAARAASPSPTRPRAPREEPAPAEPRRRTHGRGGVSVRRAAAAASARKKFKKKAVSHTYVRRASR